MVKKLKTRTTYLKFAAMEMQFQPRIVECEEMVLQVRVVALNRFNRTVNRLEDLQLTPLAF